MKISHAKVFIMFLFYIDTTFPESIQISRFIPGGKKANWQGVEDSFVIPQSECYRENSRTNVKYCKASCTTDDTEGLYSCSCSHYDATVTNVNKTWRCLENKEVRNELGCANNTLFHSEKKWHKLRTLNTLWERRTALSPQASCVVNTSSSWFIGCHGERVPLSLHTNRTKEMFRLRVQWELSYYIKVIDPLAIFQGRVINLGISCSQPPSLIKEGCLLFKLNGSITCPVGNSTGPVVSSTLTPTTSSLIPTSLSTTLIKTATKEPTRIGPTQTTTQANLGRKGKSDDVNSSSPPLGIIAGVTVSIIFVLVLIFAFLIYRRRKSRNDTRTSTTGQIDTENTAASNSKTNQAFQLEERNRYQTNDPPSSFIKRKKCPQNSGPLSTDNPLYYTVEDLSGTDTGTPVDIAPNQPDLLYNALQEPYAKGSDDPVWYGSSTADGPHYNTLEGPYQYGGSPRTNEPLYNVLEAPSPSGADEESSYGSLIVQNPVYDALQGPNPDKSSENLLYSSSMEVQHPNDSENVPVYAVAYEKGK